LVPWGGGSMGGFLSLCLCCNMEMETKTSRSWRLVSREQIRSMAMLQEHDIPVRFVTAEKGDVEKARERWEKTNEWRVKQHVDNILEEPQERFDMIKQSYSHAFHGTSKEGDLVYYDKPGTIDWKGIENQKIELEDMIRHIVFIQEFIWNVLKNNETAKIVSVIDISGMSMSLHGPGMELLKAVLAIMEAHYPERAMHIFIINVPFGFSTMWKVVSRFIDPETRKKIHIEHGNGVISALAKVIDDSERPAEYGGSGGSLGSHPNERALLEHVADRLAMSHEQNVAAKLEHYILRFQAPKHDGPCRTDLECKCGKLQVPA